MAASRVDNRTRLPATLVCLLQAALLVPLPSPAAARGRGGKGGGGFGRGSSAGSSGSGVSSTGFLIGIAAASVFVITILVVSCYIFRQKRKNPSPRRIREQARQDIVKACKAHSKLDSATDKPVSGRYQGSYTDSGRVHRHDIHFVFERTSVADGDEPNLDGSWTVAGHGRDDDGEFKIMEGYVAPDGQAYWVEKSNKYVGLQVLVKGRFEVHGEFRDGHWIASNGRQGVIPLMLIRNDDDDEEQASGGDTSASTNAPAAGNAEGTDDRTRATSIMSDSRM